MSFGSFVKAIEADVAMVWNAIKGSPAVQQIETIAVEACASELMAVAQKFLGAGTPIDDVVNAGIEELAAKIVAAIPSQG